jgi:hypothetical protein
MKVNTSKEDLEKGLGTSLKFHHNAALPTRIEKHEGQDHLVVPVVMMVEGVHRGNAGPMLYEPGVYGTNPHLWNGVPLPVYHPTQEEAFVSCNSPEVIEEFSVGRLYNVKMEEGKLKGEMWINILKASIVSPGLVGLIQSGAPMDVSTGLFTIDDMTPGVWNEEPYVGSVKAIMPDHLAILPGQTGACSFADGCGVRLNTEGKEKGDGMKNQVGVLTRLRDTVIAILADAEDPKKATWVNHQFASLVSKLGPNLLNAVSTEQVRRGLQMEVDKMDIPPEPQPGVLHFITAIFSEEAQPYFVFEARTEGEPSKFYKQGYVVENEVVSMKGERSEVREEFIAASENKTGITNTEQQEEKDMERKAKVDLLINTKGSPYKEENREALTALADAEFDLMFAGNEALVTANEATTTATSLAESLKTKEPEKKVDPKVNKEPDPKKPLTTEEFIAAAPAAVGQMLSEGMAMRTSRKTSLIEVLTANEACPFTKEALELKDIPELESLVTLAGCAIPETDYSGKTGAVVTHVKANERQDDGRGVPVMPNLTTLMQEKK